MYAVIKTGGKQYRVQQGDIVRVEFLPVEAGESVEFDSILMVGDDESTTIGSPVVEGAKVRGTVVRHDKDRKVIVHTYKRRKNSNRKTSGHRQTYTEIKIDAIEA